MFSRSSASASAKQTLFFVEVTDAMQIHPGEFNCKIFFLKVIFYHTHTKYFKEYYLYNVIDEPYFKYTKISNPT